MRLLLLMSILTNFALAHDSVPEVVKGLSRIPKTELHLHLGGSYPADFLYSIATPKQERELRDFLQKIQNSNLPDYHECFKVFPLISQIVNTSDKVLQGTVALCKELQKQNVTYVEIRSGLKDLGDGLEAYLEAMMQGIALAKTEGFTANILISLRREDQPEQIKRSVDLAIKYKDSGVVGLDISGDSSRGDYRNLVLQVKRAREEGLSVALHLGENSKETSQLKELFAFKPKRIGHGVHLTPDAVEWIREHKIPVEVCLRSSVMAKMVKSAKDHPWLVTNHPICLCTDDPLVFGTDLVGEYLLALESLGEDALSETIGGARLCAFDRL